MSIIIYRTNTSYVIIILLSDWLFSLVALVAYLVTTETIAMLYINSLTNMITYNVKVV